nr:protein unc-13 homolog C-like [Misgurnus anguillicaudatus]
MSSQSKSSEPDEANDSCELKQKISKKRDLGKKRAQSPRVSRSLRKKIQRFLQGSGECTTFDSEQSPVEIEDDMFICGIKRNPSRQECSVSTQRSFESHATTHKSTFIGQVELNSEGNVTIPCIMGKKGPADQAEDSGSDCADGSRAMDIKQCSKNKEKDAKGGGTSTIVEHILKELQGINKIQEEISDLRQYLTSVSGSVDEVSCCVDAVLMEIEEMYSVGAAGNPSPQRHVAHQRSPGRQTAIAVSKSRNNSPVAKQRELDKNKSRSPVARTNISDWDAPTNYQNAPPRAKLHPDISKRTSRVKKSRYSYHERVYKQEFTSNSSMSSGHSSNSRNQEGSYNSRDVDQQSVGWRSSEMQLSTSGEGGWSGDTGWCEEDYCSCQNSAEELENDTHSEIWYRYNGGETSSTPGHSSRSSSEHLSLLFGNNNDSPSSSSSVADWRHAKKPTLSDVGCDCTSNCMYSRSSGYHTMDAYADESCSGPSRSLSCSTIGMADYSDACQNVDSSCEHCICEDRLDMEWPEGVCPSASEDHLNPDYSENTDSEESQPSNRQYDIVKVNKAVLTFHSALRGALMKLDNPESQRPNEDTKYAVFKSSELQSSTFDESHLSNIVPSDLSGSPQKSSEVSFHGTDELELQNQPHSFQSFDPLVSTPSTVSSSHTPTEYCLVDHLDKVDEPLTDLRCIPEVSPKHVHLNSDNEDHVACNNEINPEGTNSELSETDVNTKQAEHSFDNDTALIDPHHQKCLANIQRVLKEKRHQHRQSRIANASKSTFSEEDFKQGTTQNLSLHLGQPLVSLTMFCCSLG